MNAHVLSNILKTETEHIVRIFIIILNGDNMDNSFYEQTDYGKNRQKRKKKAENGTAIKIFAIQMSLALLISGFLYLICKNDGDLSKNIKALYSAACEKDISASEMLDVFKKVSQMTFAPSKSEDTSLYGDKETDETEPETETGVYEAQI